MGEKVQIYNYNHYRKYKFISSFEYASLEDDIVCEKRTMLQETEKNPRENHLSPQLYQSRDCGHSINALTSFLTARS